ncbi:MAG TPA: aldose epimerase family protein, partial [Anseongella sp.]|nr:aldose epimerase family protein [Anseongella sp.]
ESSRLEIDGRPVYTIELANSRQTSVRISNYGCLILSWIVKDKNGEDNNIVLGFDSPEDYMREEYLENYPYFGVLVGRYANRIKDGRFRINDELYQLPMNKGLDHIHGGHRGFDRVVWELHEIQEARSKAIFRYSSPDGEEGYPGNLDLSVSFELTEDNELIQHIAAETDRATPVNLTHHDYFNLNSGRGRIDGHWLCIPAGSYLEQDENLVVNGRLIPVENTWHDFREGKKIGLHLPHVGEYDQTFVLDKAYGELSLAASLHSPDSGLCLRVSTTEPVCHLYTGKWIPSLKGRNGQDYGPFSGLCLEMQRHPNAVNIPEFPDTILRPGEEYRQTTRYKLTVEDLPAR